MEFIKKYFEKRPVGFYISLSACALCIIASITYWLGYLLINQASIGKYYTWTTPTILLVGSLLFLVVMYFDKVAEVATPILWVSTLSAFGLSLVGQPIEKGYMYFTEAFYNGFSFSAIFSLAFGFVVPFTCMILALGLSFAGIVMKQGRRK